MQQLIQQPAKQPNPVAGLLNVKVPALGKKSRLANWKVWRSFWVTAKRARCPKGLRGVQLSLAPLKDMHLEEPEGKVSKVFIPCGSCIKRTSSRNKSYVFAIFPSASSSGPALMYLAGRSESESERWMRDINKFLDPNFITEIDDVAQFEVTALPCALNAAVGISGMVGLLGLRPSGLALRTQSAEGETKLGHLLGAWGWRQIDHARCRLAAAALPEDDGKICVIRTTSLFPNGAGDMTLFCARGRHLVKALQTKTASLLSTLQSDAGKRVRRVSRSEGDLRFAFALMHKNAEADSATAKTKKWIEKVNAESQPASMPAGNPYLDNIISLNRVRCNSDRNPCDQGTPTSGITSLSGSPSDGGISEDDLQDFDEPNPDDFLDQRRISNVSTASGVYETIEDDMEDRGPARVDEPPPLPPREYKLYARRRPGGLHAFLRLHRLWRSNSENHVVAHSEGEEDAAGSSDVIYSELSDPPESPGSCPDSEQDLKVSNLQHSSSCSNLPQQRPEEALEESIYLSMNACQPRKRVSSESATFLSRRKDQKIVGGDVTSNSHDNIYVTMNIIDRKQSLTSEIYALVTGIEPSANKTSGP
ncbi:uncharacterized protein LOC132196905 [Neocloeon triangulifer]|uniref:uncharacterized protein LOC132196905 n=1 Tax=Neocloeon triangulifer TaxID=2078957 RepID=UPI00286F971D|nr:uncharacterized protein LOC132196905 [Neocloeon triangulifer]